MLHCAVPLGEALVTVFQALGKTVAPLEPDVDAVAILDEAARAVGLSVEPFRLLPDEPPPNRGAGALLELPDGRWLPLLMRPGADLPVALDTEGEHHLLPDRLEHAGRVLVIGESQELELETATPSSFLFRHFRQLAPIFTGGILTNMMILVLPLFGAFVYDKVLGNGVSETLWAMAAGVVLSILLDYAARGLRVLLVERLAVKTESDIDQAVFRNLLLKTGGLPAVGLVLDKYKQILSSRDFISSSYLLAAADLPFLVLFLVAVTYVAGPLVLAPICCGLLTVVLNLLFFAPARYYEKVARVAGEQRISVLADVLMGREAIVCSPLRRQMAAKWRRMGDAAGVAAGRARTWNALAMNAGGGMTNLAYVAVMVGGAYMVEQRILTSGGMIATSMLTSRFMISISSLVLLVTRYRDFRRSLQEMNELLPSATGAEALPRSSDPAGDIQLCSVTYRPRAEGRAVFSNVDLRIRRGEVVGLAGAPGAGKTSLMRLIAGIELPSEGQALLDMVPVSGWDTRQLGRAIGYKPQDAMLFEGSVEENIRGGNHHAKAEEVLRAVQISGLIHVIERGEMTLSTQVGPRGSFLSGGQRQMVALARAVLGQPAILLLDEPTTGMDAVMEKAIADYIASLQGQCTVLVSSHSRSVLEACTRIIVLNGGRVAADGPKERIIQG